LVPLFLIGVVLSSIRFQLLSPSFWETTFRSNNIYTNLSAAIKTTAEQKTVKDGGSLKEVKVLTNLITPANLQYFLEKNIKNILDFANGKAKEAVVYIPIKILPRGLLPTNFGKITENTPLTTLLTEFHVQGVQPAQIQSISKFGQTVSYLLALDVALFVLVLIGLILLADSGKHFVAPGVGLIIGGVAALAFSLLGFVIRTSMLTDWVKSTEPSQIILAPFAPYLLAEIIKIWTTAGALAVLAGGVLIFFKKK